MKLGYSHASRFIAEHWPEIVLIGLVAVFYFLTIRGGHNWSGDYALFIAHAGNIVNGLAYAATGYIHNPYYPGLSPVAYPPVFSLMLAPVYAVFGLYLIAFKWVVVASFIVFLIFYYRFCLDKLNLSVSRLGAVIAIALNGLYWENKDLILSYYPFMMFTFAALVLMEQLTQAELEERRRLTLAVLTGFCIYLAYGTRSVGLVLIPTLVAADLIRLKFRSISLSTIVALIVFGVFYLIQNVYLSVDKSYLSDMNTYLVGNTSDTPPRDLFTLGSTYLKSISHNVVTNLEKYMIVVWRYWSNDFGKIAQAGMFLLTGVFALVGFIAQLKSKSQVGELFLLFYVGLLLVVPFYLDQFLLPAIPLYAMYIFRGAERMSTARLFAGKGTVPGLLLLLIAFLFLGTYRLDGFADFKEGPEKKESVELFKFLREHTPDDSVIVFRRPRIIALHADRKSSVYHRTEKPEQLWDYFHRIHATHIAVKLDEHDDLPSVVEHYRTELTQIFENNDFRVYKINDHKS